MMAVSLSGLLRDILTNVHVSAVNAGRLSVSSGLAHEPVSSSNSFRFPELVATVDLTHISIVS